MLATTLIALALARAAVADVTPTGPSGSDVYKEGEPCKIEWTGDVSGAWAGMAIQLMSGDNFQMVPVTTVATDQDGNTDGTFEYTCPEVTPNSAIYFYQFTAPGSPNTTWTTRWTLAAADGSTTPPANSTQPGGAAIPWGVGALDDASAVVPPPTFTSSASGSGSGSGSVTTSAATSKTETEVVTSTRVSTATSSGVSRSGSAAGATSTDNAAMGLKASGALVLSGLVAALFL